MMVKKKHRNLYKSMMKNRKRRENEAKNLERKRQDFDTKQTAALKKKHKDKAVEA
jgi:pescadillo protein